MDDLNDPETDELLGRLRRGLERRKSLIASSEDIAGTHESLDGQWGEWMCPNCGTFMKEHRRRCWQCDTPRI